MSSTTPIVEADPVPPVNIRRRQIVYALQQAHAQAEGLLVRLTAARSLAIDTRATLNTVKETAAVDLSNPDAGDTAIAALTEIIDAIDVAVLAVREIPNLTYEDYE